MFVASTDEDAPVPVSSNMSPVSSPVKKAEPADAENVVSLGDVGKGPRVLV